MIKIAFFDVDGTLLPLGQKDLNPPVLQALQSLQRQGIKLFLASGRPRFALPHFEGIEFDGGLSFNGQLCFDDERILYKNPLENEDVWKIYENAKRLDIALAASQEGCFHASKEDPTLIEYFKVANQVCSPISDFEAFLKEDLIYEMMSVLKTEQESALLEGTKNVQVVRWWPYACDLIPATGGKGIGVQAILKAYGLSREEAISFGDGGNDLEMLRSTGFSVAMGNALDVVKGSATYITKTVDEDGVVWALRHFGLIE